MFTRLRDYRIIPTVDNVEVSEALNIAEALVEADLPVMEIVYRNHDDAKKIRVILEEFPEFIIGAGGILNSDLLLRACDAGARFVTSPGVNSLTINEAKKHNVSYASGICTPTDVESALAEGITNLLFFPAQYFGGAAMLKELVEPFAHLNIDVVAKGGITEQNIHEYLRVPEIAAVYCPWIIEEDSVQYKNWGRITEMAQNTVKLCTEKQPVYFT